LYKSIIKVKDVDNAVIIRLGRVIKSVGPGLHFKLPIDTSKKIPSIILVYPGSKNKISSIAYTKDGVPTKVEGLIHYKVKNPMLYAKNYEIEKELQKDFNQNSHADHLRSQFIAATREIINPIKFNNLFSKGVSPELIKDQMNRIMKDFGIEIIDVTIENIEPPIELQETARKIIEQKAQTEYLKNMADVMKGDTDKLIELLYITGSSNGNPAKSFPIKEKIRKKRLAQAESESFKTLEEKLGPNMAKKLRELQAMEKLEDVKLRKKDFEK